MKAFVFFLLCMSLGQGIYAMTEQQIEVRDLEGINRLLILQGSVYKIKLTRESHPLKMREASAIIALTEYALCSNQGMTPERQSSHFEPDFIDAHFKCKNKRLTLAEWRDQKVATFCKEGTIIQTPAQEVLCRELGLFMK